MQIPVAFLSLMWSVGGWNMNPSVFLHHATNESNMHGGVPLIRVGAVSLAGDVVIIEDRHSNSAFSYNLHFVLTYKYCNRGTTQRLRPRSSFLPSTRSTVGINSPNQNYGSF